MSMQTMCRMTLSDVPRAGTQMSIGMRKFVSAMVAVVTAMAFLMPSSLWAQVGTPLSTVTTTGLYARAIRLSYNANASLNGNIVVSVTSFLPSGAGEELIYGSSNNGASFTQIGSIQDPLFAGGLCCGTLFELPSAVGSMPAGTLLWAGSVGQSSTTLPMQIRIYESLNQGVTWTYLSALATATQPDSVDGGLWEPSFEIAQNGTLVGFYSDETVPGYSQLINMATSTDGINWQMPSTPYAVASNNEPDRPGMAVVTKLPSGIYFMTFELCGPAGCTVFYKTSPDGLNWAPASNVGSRVQTSDGDWFQAAPTNAWAPSATNSNGTIMVVGQTMWGPSGLSSGNGITIFTNNSADGSGNWSTMTAPVAVTDATQANSCSNYSSPLLPSTNGLSVLELASDYVGTTCTMYYGTSAITTGTVTPTLSITGAPAAMTAGTPVTVDATVVGPTGDPTPTGTVTLISEPYFSSQTLSNGSTTITIPANSLSVGTDTLTASYSGDSNYSSASSGSSIVVTAAPGITLSANSPTIAPGTTGAITVTVTPVGGFTGNVALTYAYVQSPTPSAGALNPPTLSFGSTSPVSITGTAAETATLTVATDGGATAMAQPAGNEMQGYAAGGAALGCLLFLCVPRRRRLWRAVLGMSLLLVVVVGGMTACGNGTAGKSSETSQGVYIIAVTATSGSITASQNVTFTIK